MKRSVMSKECAIPRSRREDVRMLLEVLLAWSDLKSCDRRPRHHEARGWSERLWLELEGKACHSARAYSDR